MIQLEFSGIGHVVNFPESLAECDNREYVEMCKLIFLYNNKQINIHEFQRLAVYSLLNVERSKKPLSAETEKKIAENIALLTDFVMNFYDIIEDDTGNESIAIKLDFIHNPMPVIKYYGQKFVGPKDNFQDVTFGQYIDGLSFFYDYEKFKDHKTLVKLFEIFYKPKFPRLNKLFKIKLDNLDIGILFGFFLYFASFQKWLSSGAEVYYSGVKINLSIIFESDTKGEVSSIPGLGMKSLFHSVAESNVFGPADKLRETPLWDVLPVLYEMRKNALDEKAAMEKIKNKKK